MEDELLYEENIEEDVVNTDSGDSAAQDVPTSKYENTFLYDKTEITSDILSALEEEGYISKSGNEPQELRTNETTTPSGEYYDLLIQMNSHLEYIEEHLYETPSGHDLRTPLNQYDLSEMLLIGVLVILGLSFVFNVIKDNVIHIR